VQLESDLDMQITPFREKIIGELKRVKQFEHMLLGNKNSAVVKDIDIRNYAKFIF
jgi:hypothetical protein